MQLNHECKSFSDCFGFRIEVIVLGILTRHIHISFKSLFGRGLFYLSHSIG